MAQNIENQMKMQGYKKVNGMAILNDVAVTSLEMTNKVLSPILSTKQAVDAFNNEFSDGWDLYRKVDNKTIEQIQQLDT